MAKRVGAVRKWMHRGKLRVCLEFWLEGKRRRIYNDVDRWGRKIELTEETAQDLLEDVRAEIRKRRNIESALAPFLGAAAPENEFGKRWESFIKQKGREVVDGRISSRHLDELVGIERRGYLVWLKDRSIFELDYGALEDWLAWLAETKPDIKGKTRKHALTAVMTCLRWLKKRGEEIELPELPEIPIDEHAPALLSDADRASVIAEIEEEKRGIFLAMAYMGLRVSEARALEARSYRDGYITIDKAPKDKGTEAEAKGTKTRRVRRLPVPAELSAWLDPRVSDADRISGAPLFRNPKGHTDSKRWSPSALDRVWNAACVKALGHRAAPLYEGTRHSFATSALNAGAEMYHVQKFLGHTSSKTTERYAKLADGALVGVLKPRRKP